MAAGFRYQLRVKAKLFAGLDANYTPEYQQFIAWLKEQPIATKLDSLSTWSGKHHIYKFTSQSDRMVAYLAWVGTPELEAHLVTPQEARERKARTS